MPHIKIKTTQQVLGEIPPGHFTVQVVSQGAVVLILRTNFHSLQRRKAQLS